MTEREIALKELVLAEYANLGETLGDLSQIEDSGYKLVWQLLRRLNVSMNAQHTPRKEALQPLANAVNALSTPYFEEHERIQQQMQTAPIGTVAD